jgi:hypothetical protein
MYNTIIVPINIQLLFNYPDPLAQEEKR